MVCTHGFIWDNWEETAYKRRVTGEEETFREWKKTRVSCTVCGVTVSASYFKTHMTKNHGICVPQTRGVDEERGGPTIYVVSFPLVLQEVKFPVLGCPSVAHNTGILRENFMYCHFRSKVLVVQEVTEPLPRCDLRGMHMPSGWLIRQRRTTCCNKNNQMG